ncbi:hypothetical protein EIP91_007797 [Steccherinum ochraceum]|uniref:Uncharacterized protein n=1 Tax=Steccherinum ochraceum TaxID=92696 RepID=A0A4R0R6H1_9APHY|nr:hypothetical protein EIP91_007797 [Steccherinum ochraceum]
MAASLPSRSTPPLNLRRTPSSLHLDHLPEYPSQFVSTPTDWDTHGPPSPTSTEIIDVESEDFMRTAQRHGVKVRDYAVEASSLPTPPPVKEYWDPLLTLLRHDVFVRRPGVPANFILPKDLWRLLDSGWVTEEEAERNWDAEDWEMMKSYRDQPGGPYTYVVGTPRTKPTAALRISLRKSAFPPYPGDKPDEDIFTPDDEPGMWDGDGDEGAETETEDEAPEESQNVGYSHLAKKRKVVSEGSRDTKGPLSLLQRFVSAPFMSPSPSTPVASPSLSRAGSSRNLASPRKKRTLTRNQTLVRVQ